MTIGRRPLDNGRHYYLLRPVIRLIAVDLCSCGPPVAGEPLRRWKRPGLAHAIRPTYDPTLCMRDLPPTLCGNVASYKCHSLMFLYTYIHTEQAGGHSGLVNSNR